MSMAPDESDGPFDDELDETAFLYTPPSDPDARWDDDQPDWNEDLPSPNGRHGRARSDSERTGRPLSGDPGRSESLTAIDGALRRTAKSAIRVMDAWDIAA